MLGINNQIYIELKALNKIRGDTVGKICDGIQYFTVSRSGNGFSNGSGEGLTSQEDSIRYPVWIPGVYAPFSSIRALDITSWGGSRWSVADRDGNIFYTTSGYYTFYRFNDAGREDYSCSCTPDSCRIDCASAPDGFCCIDNSFTDRLLQVLGA